MQLPDLISPEEAKALLAGETTRDEVLAGLGLPPEEAAALHRETDAVVSDLDRIAAKLTHPRAVKAAAKSRRKLIEAREWEKHFARVPRPRVADGGAR